MSHHRYYQEINLLPDASIDPYFLWSKLFNQLHIALADIKNKHNIKTIGVSLPEYYFDSKNEQKSKLGLKLRVFAVKQEDLEKLNLDTWLERLTTHLSIEPIKKVPAEIKGYATVHRYRFKNKEKQVKSLAEKLGIKLEEALESVDKRKPKKNVPFIKVRSLTNNTDFPLRVLQECTDHPKPGSFNTYGMNGMSTYATVPVW